jgi:competence protein ComGC
MPIKNYFLYSKLLHNLKLHKFKVVILLLILIIIILFINHKSLFKIIEGNAACKYTNQKQLEKDVEATAEKYKKENNKNPSVGGFEVKGVLGNVDDVKSRSAKQ